MSSRTMGPTTVTAHDRSRRSNGAALLVSAALVLVLILAMRSFSVPWLDGALLLAAAIFVPLTWQSINRTRGSRDSVLILGNGQLAGSLRKALLDSQEGGTDAGRQSRLGLVRHCDEDLDQDRLRDLILANGISNVVVTGPEVATSHDLLSVLLECKFRGVKVTSAPDFYEGLNKKVWLEAASAEDLVYSRTLYPDRGFLLQKRVLDLLCAVGVLVITLPLMLVVAVLIKLDSRGPVLFRQERVGLFGEPFTLYKFRSMREDAEGETGPVWAKEEDDRVTRIGGFLRRTHLDELPQVFNVIKNELSFVGPRPERECFAAKLEAHIPLFRLREYVKPGITGWAQVSFPYGDSIETCYEKLQYDLYYAKHASLAFDLKILLMTVHHVIFQRGR